MSLLLESRDGEDDREEIDNCGEVVKNRGRMVKITHGFFSFLKICREVFPLLTIKVYHTLESMSTLFRKFLLKNPKIMRSLRGAFFLSWNRTNVRKVIRCVAQSKTLMSVFASWNS